MAGVRRQWPVRCPGHNKIRSGSAICEASAEDEVCRRIHHLSWPTGECYYGPSGIVCRTSKVRRDWVASPNVLPKEGARHCLPTGRAGRRREGVLHPLLAFHQGPEVEHPRTSRDAMARPVVLTPQNKWVICEQYSSPFDSICRPPLRAAAGSSSFTGSSTHADRQTGMGMGTIG